MATTQPSVGTLPRGAPTAQQLDSLPSRLAQAAGVRAGTSQAAVGAVTAALTAAEGPALVASDQIQTVVEDAMTLAAQVAMASTGQAIAAIEQLLAPLQQDVATFIKATTKRRGCRSGAPAGGVTGPSAGTAPPIPVPGTTPPIPIVQPRPSGPGTTPPRGTTGTQTIYTIWYHCGLGEVAAVPNTTSQNRTDLQTQGWTPVYPPGAITASSPTEAQTYLEGIASAVSSMCAVPLRAVPNSQSVP